MRRISSILLALACALPCGAETVTLPAAADSTIYENFSDSGNGTGEWIFTSVTNTGAIRRALIRFDLSGIPPGSQIESATLKMKVSRGQGASPNVGLHRIGESWTEGGTNSEGQEGAPDLASPGDVTWEFRSFNTLSWTTLGGSFTAAPSATLIVPNTNVVHTWNSTAAMVADVQAWVDTPAANFGWLLKPEVETGRRSRRWNSRSNPDTPPQLTVVYAEPPLFANGFESGDTSGWSLTDP